MTRTTPAWEAYLSSRFIGYLLPASAASALTAEEAQRFLERLTGRPHQLDLLRATSVLAPRAARFEVFASRWVPDLVRVLPSRNAIVTREWEGDSTAASISAARSPGGSPDPAASS